MYLFGNNIMKDYFTGSTNVTHPFQQLMSGFVISNDGTSDLTITINSLTITVKSGEVFGESFEPFSQVSINTNVPYRAYGLMQMQSGSSDTTSPLVSVSPNGGTFTSVQQVILSSNEPATIYYTVDGSTPTFSSSIYSSSIPISATTTLKFFGKDSVGNSSAVQTHIYTVNISSKTALYSDGNANGGYIKLPSITMDKIIVDGIFSSGATVYRYLISGKNGYVRANADQLPVQSSGFASVSSGFAWDTRISLTANTLTPFTDTIVVLARNDGYSLCKGYLFKITCYNGATIVAQYDFTTQFSGTSVADSSGNGYTATIMGTPTWVTT